MHTLKPTFKFALSCLCFCGTIAGTGLAMAVAALFLVGLVDWTGAPQTLRFEPIKGATEDVRADFVPEPAQLVGDVPTQISEHSPRQGETRQSPLEAGRTF